MKQTIGIGTVANDGTGDTLRNAFDKTNDNFDEIYNAAVEPTYFYFASGNFRIGERGGSLWVDQTITATGFAGTQGVDWDAIHEFTL